MPTIKELRHQRGKICADMQALLPTSGAMSRENQQKFDALDKEATALKEVIDRNERAAELDAELRTSRKTAHEPGIGDSVLNERDFDHRKAFRSYLVNGELGISEKERGILREHRDMGTGGGNALQGTGGGYFVPVGFVDEVETALKYYGDMLRVAKIMPTDTGQPLPYPTSNDTATIGEQVGEGVQVTTNDVNLSNVIFGAYKYSTKMVKVSMELLQDSAFDIESFLKEQFAIRLGRILNTKFTTGSGTNEPKGIITAASVGLSQSTTPAITGDDNATSPDPTQQVGYIDLVNLEHSVDILYRSGAKYMMHDQTLRFIKTLKDKFGHPLWVPGVAANAPDRILGYEYSINNDMAQLGAGNKALAFGRLDKYLVRRVREMSVLRLTERFADYGQVAFIGFARYDGNLLDAGTKPVMLAQNHS